jgi:hypothetical protein
MSSHYYLVASLPMLFFGEPPPFSTAEFRRRCEGVLDAGDARTLDLVLAGRGAEASAAGARAWAAIDAQFRNAIAHIRAGAHGVDPRPLQRSHPGFSVAVEQAVADAFAKPTPLDRELELDRSRWAMLDELALTEPFGLAAVIAFGVKLQLAGRWAAMTDAAGRLKLDQLIQQQTDPHRPQPTH